MAGLDVQVLSCMIPSMPRKQKPEHLRRRPGRPNVYNWDTIFDGTRRTYTQGLDFDCSLVSFRTQAYLNAKERGVKIRTKVQANWLSIEAVADSSAVASDGRYKYDWARLLDGETHELQLGRDIKVDLKSFRTHAHAVAKARGKRLTTRSVGNLVLLRAVPLQRFAPAQPEVDPNQLSLDLEAPESTLDVWEQDLLASTADLPFPLGRRS